MKSICPTLKATGTLLACAQTTRTRNVGPSTLLGLALLFSTAAPVGADGVSLNPTGNAYFHGDSVADTNFGSDSEVQMRASTTPTPDEEPIFHDGFEVKETNEPEKVLV